MQRMTIDFGIDLGTTNSAISVMEGGAVEVVKVGGKEVLPSANYIDKKGTRHVGEAARNNWAVESKMDDCAIEFKRQMGTQATMAFKSASIELGPEELSASVLSKLRGSAGQRFNTEPPAAAVITIPAMFETAQRKATANAGKLAGFQHVELLQEPVAAALAYGFDTADDNQFWMVYDFGGGTFDVSIIAIRDGELSVVEHAGDNYLGGSDLDWAVVEKLLLPKLSQTADVSHLNRSQMESDDQVKSSMRKLKMIAEEIKVLLSSEESVDFYREDAFKGRDGELDDIDCTITRSEFDDVIRNHVEKTIGIVQELMKSTALGAGEISKIIMVGGSTYVPLVRELVGALGIRVDYSMDPMTVVSEGAAVYAASRRMPDGLGTSVSVSSGLGLALQYNPVSRDTESLVMGRLKMNDGSSLPNGLKVEIERADHEWSSGTLQVDASGVFSTNVTVKQGQANGYTVKATAENGILDVSPNVFTITYGASMESATLPASLRLELATGMTKLMISRGSTLPATTVDPIKVVTVKELVAGSNDSVLIPYADGEHVRAERCRRGGKIMIKGTDIPRTMPSGTELEVSATVDVSGVLACKVYVPLIDESFDSAEEILVHDIDQLVEQRDAVRSRLSELEAKASAAGDSQATQQLAAIKSSGRLEDIDRELAAAQGSGDGGAARNGILALQSDLDAIDGRVEWPTILQEYQELLERARRLLHEDRDSQSSLAKLEQEDKNALR